MRSVIQSVSSASVTIDGAVTAQIGRGLLVLLGIQAGDTEPEAIWLAEKIAALRLFEDDAGKMNLSVVATRAQVLIVSQFTLLASTRKGNRPSFNDAARPEVAVPLYEFFVQKMTVALGSPVATGHFGAMMQVALVNDGPVTLVLDSRLRE